MDFLLSYRWAPTHTHTHTHCLLSRDPAHIVLWRDDLQACNFLKYCNSSSTFQNPMRILQGHSEWKRLNALYISTYLKVGWSILMSDLWQFPFTKQIWSHWRKDVIERLMYWVVEVQICPEMAGLFFLQLFLMLLWMTPTESKADTAMCTMTDSFQFAYKHYQAGRFIIGAIGTQFGCMSDAISFREQPITTFGDEHV